jgi:predicted transcriptional regulator
VVIMVGLLHSPLCANTEYILCRMEWNKYKFIIVQYLNAPMANQIYLRSRFEIIVSILKTMTLGDSVRITEIQYKAFLPYRRLKTYLSFLGRSGLIEYLTSDRKLRITQKGIRALEALIEMEELMTGATHSKVEYSHI